MYYINLQICKMVIAPFGCIDIKTNRRVNMAEKFDGCLVLSFNTNMKWNWKEDDFYRIVESIKNKSPYVTTWTVASTVKPDAAKRRKRLFVYYTNKKKFIASGYIAEDGIQPCDDGKNRIRIIFDWVVDYDDDNAGLKYSDLQEGKFGKPLDFPLFRAAMISSGKDFLQSKDEFDTLEDAWKAVCPNYPGPDPSILDKLPTTENTVMAANGIIAEIYELLKEKKQVILTGAPGTGKTFMTSRIAAELLHVEGDPEYGDKKQIEENIRKGKKLERYAFVQFHPGYDYSDFVQGLKPEPAANGIVFNVKDGIFYDFCERAGKYSDKALGEGKGLPYVMVIDEINRADLSRVFGELFYGLEAGYRNCPFSTQYSYLTKKDFCIPDNVYIIGTMNDIDRSVESMDFALRRRFGWREITAEESQNMLYDKDSALRDKIIRVMNGINQHITDKQKLALDDAYKLGAAYFKNVQADKQEEWDKLWRTSLKIILNDYRRSSGSGEEISEDDFNKLVEK